jgi:hypothetical protein
MFHNDNKGEWTLLVAQIFAYIDSYCKAKYFYE